MRDIYEVPAAEVILTAHKELEKLVGTIHQNNFKPELDRHWAYLVYAGLWYEPLLADLNAFMDSVNAWVTGTITLRLYKGTRDGGRALLAARALRRRAGGLRRVGRPVQPAGEPGFIELWSLQSRMAHRVRTPAIGGIGGTDVLQGTRIRGLEYGDEVHAAERTAATSRPAIALTVAAAIAAVYVATRGDDDDE